MNSVLVVGAGPYGLSVAAHLRSHGIETVVLGKPMGAWRDNMPAGMFLKSEPDASSLSSPASGSRLHDYYAEAGLKRLGVFDPVPIEQFVDYGLWFANRHVPEIRPVTVKRLARDGATFDAELSSGETTRHSSVVMATGHVAYSYVPPELVALAPEGISPDALLSHASQHTGFDRYAGRRVAVVGRGQSALESAALLCEAGAAVTVLVRAGSVIWNDTPASPEHPLIRRLRTPKSALGRGWKLFLVSRGPAAIQHLPEERRLALVRSTLGPSGAWWLRDRLDGRVDIALDCRLDATAGTDGTARLRLGSSASLADVLEVDHVIAATGYRIDLDALPLLDDVLRKQLARVEQAPRLDRSFESSVPGLYFAGLAAAPTFGPVMRFVAGADFAARRISNAISRRTPYARAA